MANKIFAFFIFTGFIFSGASSGIGKALSIQLFNLGANIIISSRSKSSLDACAQECIAGGQQQTTAMGNKIICIPLDLEKFQERNRLFCIIF